MTVALNTLTVKVVNGSGKPMFENPRFLRIVESGPNKGLFAVARHGKALIVTGIAGPDAVVVDGTAARIDLATTRASKLADIGKVAVTKPVAPASAPSELGDLVAKYLASITKRGRVWIENALTHTKDPVKREAMEIALGNKPAAKPVKAKSKVAPKAKPAGVNVADLTAALIDAGVPAETVLKAITPAA